MELFHKKFCNITLIILSVFTIIACERKPTYVDSYVIEKEGLYGLIDSNGNEIVAPRFLTIEPIQKDGVALAIIDTIYTSVIDSTFIGIRNIPVINIKYGYVTSEDKFLLPEPSYVKIKTERYINPKQAYSRFCQEASFYGGLAVAQDTATLLYGYIGLNGDTIIPAKYRTAYRFNEGRAAVQLDLKKGVNDIGKWGLIDPDGKNICDFVFNKLETPIHKRAIATIITVDRQGGGRIDGEINIDENGHAYIDKSKATILEASDDPTITRTIFLVDENGKIINENMNMMYQYSNFSIDSIAIAIPNQIAKLFGAGFQFISLDGEFIEPLNANNITEEQAEKIIESKYFLGDLLPEDIKFTDATRFSEGYAAVNLGKAWIFVDKQLIPRGSDENPIYEDALPFSHGLAGIKLNGKYGYINNNFNVVIPCKYDSCAIAEKNLCRVYGGRKNVKGYSIISYIDRKGKIIWQNVNYVGNDWEKEVEKNNQVWRQFEYSYIGKNYWPLFIIILIIFLIIILLIISRYENKNSEKNKEQENVNANNREKTSDTLQSEKQATNESSLQLNDSKVLPPIIKEKNDMVMPSVHERLDNLLDL